MWPDDLGHRASEYFTNARASLSNAGGFDVITGYAALYYDGTPGTETRLDASTVERIAPGAFNESLLRGDDVVALKNHDVNHVLGRTTAGTLRLWTDDKGLRFEVQPPANGDGKQVTDSVRRGDITGASFQFIVERQSMAAGEVGGRKVKIRTLEQVRLRDVSIVTFPAYAGTSVRVESPNPDTTPVPDKPRLSAAKSKLERLAGGKFSSVADNKLSN